MPNFNPGDRFQVQTSRDGVTWQPRQPAPDSVGSLVLGGDHWFTDHHEAWVAANALRNALTWSEVRIVHCGPDGTTTREQDVL